MKIIDFITSRVLLIFPEISWNFRKISGNMKFLENLQSYSLSSGEAVSRELMIVPMRMMTSIVRSVPDCSFSAKLRSVMNIPRRANVCYSKEIFQLSLSHDNYNRVKSISYINETLQQFKHSTKISSCAQKMCSVCMKPCNSSEQEGNFRPKPFMIPTTKLYCLKH